MAQGGLTSLFLYFQQNRKYAMIVSRAASIRKNDQFKIQQEHSGWSVRFWVEYFANDYDYVQT